MSESLRDITVESYDINAEPLAEYFQGIGPRTQDIDLALQLAGNVPNPKVLEIGCGDGRDAAEIVKRTDWYLGFDISKGMIDIARRQVPDAEFEVADAVEYPYPPDLDIVFAFASLLHLSRDEVGTVLDRVASKLNPGGIFYISLKFAQDYTSGIKEDQFGKRLFYFYNPEVIEELAADHYDTVHKQQEIKGNTEWFEIALRRKPDVTI
jgi:SAM-dependent methyltransferase